MRGQPGVEKGQGYPQGQGHNPQFNMPVAGQFQQGQGQFRQGQERSQEPGRYRQGQGQFQGQGQIHPGQGQFQQGQDQGQFNQGQGQFQQGQGQGQFKGPQFDAGKDNLKFQGQDIKFQAPDPKLTGQQQQNNVKGQSQGQGQGQGGGQEVKGADKPKESNSIKLPEGDEEKLPKY